MRLREPSSAPPTPPIPEAGTVFRGRPVPEHMRFPSFSHLPHVRPITPHTARRFAAIFTAKLYGPPPPPPSTRPTSRYTLPEPLATQFNDLNLVPFPATTFPLQPFTFTHADWVTLNTLSDAVFNGMHPAEHPAYLSLLALYERASNYHRQFSQRVTQIGRIQQLYRSTPSPSPNPVLQPTPLTHFLTAIRAHRITNSPTPESARRLITCAADLDNLIPLTLPTAPVSPTQSRGYRPLSRNEFERAIIAQVLRIPRLPHIAKARLVFPPTTPAAAATCPFARSGHFGAMMPLIVVDLTHFYLPHNEKRFDPGLYCLLFRPSPYSGRFGTAPGTPAGLSGTFILLPNDTNTCPQRTSSTNIHPTSSPDHKLCLGSNESPITTALDTGRVADAVSLAVTTLRAFGSVVSDARPFAFLHTWAPETPNCVLCGQPINRPEDHGRIYDVGLGPVTEQRIVATNPSDHSWRAHRACLRWPTHPGYAAPGVPTTFDIEDDETGSYFIPASNYLVAYDNPPTHLAGTFQPRHLANTSSGYVVNTSSLSHYTHENRMAAIAGVTTILHTTHPNTMTPSRERDLVLCQYTGHTAPFMGDYTPNSDTPHPVTTPDAVVRYNGRFVWLPYLPYLLVKESANATPLIFHSRPAFEPADATAGMVALLRRITNLTGRCTAFSHGIPSARLTVVDNPDIFRPHYDAFVRLFGNLFAGCGHPVPASFNTDSDTDLDNPDNT